MEKDTPGAMIKMETKTAITRFVKLADVQTPNETLRQTAEEAE